MVCILTIFCFISYVYISRQIYIVGQITRYDWIKNDLFAKTMHRVYICIWESVELWLYFLFVCVQKFSALLTRTNKYCKRTDSSIIK